MIPGGLARDREGYGLEKSQKPRGSRQAAAKPNRVRKSAKKKSLQRRLSGKIEERNFHAETGAQQPHARDQRAQIW
jgi:hypothetical protein